MQQQYPRAYGHAYTWDPMSQYAQQYAQSVADAQRRAQLLDPRLWPITEGRLFQHIDPHSTGREPQWQDVTGTCWLEPDELFDAFELVNVGLNPYTGAQGMAQTLRQLKSLAAMGIQEMQDQDRHWVGKIVQRIKGIGAFSAGWVPPPASPMPTPPDQTFGVQQQEAYTPHSPNPYHTPSSRSTLTIPSSPLPSLASFDHSRSNSRSNSPLPSTPSHASFPSSRPYDRRAIHHPCVIHMQSVTYQALQTLYTDSWVQRNFSITPGPAGIQPEPLSGWPAGAPWGNVTLVSRALKVPGRPFSVSYANSAPGLRAHALFVPIRLCMRTSGLFRTVLLCNSELEPFFDRPAVPGGPMVYRGPHHDATLREQYEQMRCIAALLHPDPNPRAPDLGIGGRHAIGVFAGLVHATVNDQAPVYTLHDATATQMGVGAQRPRARVLHTGDERGEFVTQLGTAGATEHGKPAFLVARIGFHQVLLE